MNHRPLSRARLVILALAITLLATQAPAATVYVYIDTDYGFQPSYQEINPGDAIGFYNDDYYGASHTISSAYWNTVILQPFHGVLITFPYAGSYPYQDNYTGYSGVIVVVAPPAQPATLAAPRMFVSGAFQFTVKNLTPGKKYIVQRSTDLSTWTNVRTNTAISTTETYTDTTTALRPACYYRTQHLP